MNSNRIIKYYLRYFQALQCYSCIVCAKLSVVKEEFKRMCISSLDLMLVVGTYMRVKTFRRVRCRVILRSCLDTVNNR